MSHYMSLATSSKNKELSPAVYLPSPPPPPNGKKAKYHIDEFADVEATSPIEDSPQKTPRKRMWIPQLIAVVMLLIALNPSNPYGYYTFLRFVCCAVFAYLAFLAFEQKIHLFMWLLVVTAVVYNPIIRIQLTRDIWTIINLITIIIAIVSAIFLKREIS